MEHARQLPKIPAKREAAVPSPRREEPRSADTRGAPLDPGLRSAMERGFQHDFSAVRIHADGAAAEAAHRLRAKAFTVGSHIHFGRDVFRPGTADTRRLLAHELAHVVQQHGARPAGPDAGGLAAAPIASPGTEHEADAAATRALT